MEASTDQTPIQQPPKRSIHSITVDPHLSTVNLPVPRNPTVREVILFEEWRDAVKGEFGNHACQGTFKVVDRPRNTHLIPLTWVLRTKTKSNVGGDLVVFNGEIS